MESSDLRVFEAVAHLGGITKAAEELHTVQSNVTARIQVLEREIGQPLFRRHSRGVSLTSAGEALLPFATQISRLLSEAAQAVHAQTEPSGQLRIGSLETTAARRLPPVLVAYGASYPDVDLTIRTGTTAELLADVLEYRLDGALVAGPVEHQDLYQQVILEEELVVVSAPGCVSLSAALDQQPALKILVLRRGCSYRERLERVLQQRGNVGVRCQEFGMLDAIIGCVAAGLGITLLPRAVVQADAEAGRVALYALPSEEARVETLFVHRRDTFITAALARFIEVSRKQATGVPTARRASTGACV